MPLTSGLIIIINIPIHVWDNSETLSILLVYIIADTSHSTNFKIVYLITC